MSTRFSTDGLNFTTGKPKSLDPADQNYSGEWNDIIGKLGFTCVVVQLVRGELAYLQTELFDSLGEEMHRAGLGHLDSTQYHPYIRHFFYATTKRLAEALDFLKTNLERRGLSEISAIGHFEATEGIWRELSRNEP